MKFKVITTAYLTFYLALCIGQQDKPYLPEPPKIKVVGVQNANGHMYIKWVPVADTTVDGYICWKVNVDYFNLRIALDTVLMILIPWPFLPATPLMRT